MAAMQGEKETKTSPRKDDVNHSGSETWESATPSSPQLSSKWQRSDKKRKSDSTIRKNSWEIFAKMSEEGTADTENKEKDAKESTPEGEGFSNLQDMLQWRLEEDKKNDKDENELSPRSKEEEKRKAKKKTLREKTSEGDVDPDSARRRATTSNPAEPTNPSRNTSADALSVVLRESLAEAKRPRSSSAIPRGKSVVPQEKATQLQQLSSPSSIWDRARLETAIAEGQIEKEGESFRCQAMHPFQAQRDGDLSFNAGDFITVTKRQPSNRWWHGTLNGRSGIFPSNYVRQLTAEDQSTSSPPEEDEQKSAHETPKWKEVYPEGLEEATGEITYEEVEEEGCPTRKTKVIASGPLSKLVEALVVPLTIPEPYYVEAFLLSRSYVISSQNLLKRLIEFYTCVQDPETSEGNKSQKPMQARVLNVFQKWVENNFYDFQREPQLLEQLIQFSVDNIHTNVFVPKLVKSIRKKKRETKLTLSAEFERKLDMLCEKIFDSSGQNKLLEAHPSLAAGRSTSEKVIKEKEKKEHTRSNSEKSVKEHQKEKAKEDTEGSQITKTETSVTNWPLKEKKKGKHLLPAIGSWDKEKKKKSHRRTRSNDERNVSITFLEISAKEIAQQLTHIEQDLFVRICPLELLFGSTGKSQKYELAPNVMQIIEWFNKIVGWVATQIVTTPNAKERRLVLKRFIEIAQECKKIRNYFALQEIISALNLVCIQRLQNTWRGLSKPEMQAFTELTELMARGSNNYQAYRQEFSSTEPPHLPYVGVHLSDLVALDQLPTCIKENNHVNFKKMRKIEQAARPILSCQTFPFTTLERPRWAVYKFLTQDLVVKTDQQLFELSKQIEPSKQV